MQPRRLLELLTLVVILVGGVSWVLADDVPPTRPISRVVPQPERRAAKRATVDHRASERRTPRTMELAGHRVHVYPNILAYPNPGHHQTEFSAAVDPRDKNRLLVGSNSASADIRIGSQGWYLTSDGGATWAGGDTLPNHEDLSYFMTDPAVAIDLDGNLFFNAIRFGSDADLFVIRSTDNGATWTEAVVPDATAGEDKNHMVIDNGAESPFVHTIYTAYTDFGGRAPWPLKFSRSRDRGLTFSEPIQIDETIGSRFGQGVHLATDANGVLYAAWSAYFNFPPDSTQIGFTRSTDGGVTWDSARSIRWVQDLRGFLSKGAFEVRLNSYPVLAIDQGDGPRRGWLYVVYAEKSPVRPDVFLVRSTDGGASWSEPHRVNQDTGVGDQWLPWATVDPATGGLFVLYFDSRRFVANDSAEAWVSMSFDGGDTFRDVQVSDAAFQPAAIQGLADGYMGDYLGIAAKDGVVWPAWNDDRTGVHQLYTSRMEVVDLDGPPRLEVMPSAIDFDTAFIGYPAHRSVEIRNPAFPDTLVLDSVVISDEAFRIANVPAFLAGGQHALLNLVFDPLVEGPVAGTVTLYSHDTTSGPPTVALSGVALDAPILFATPDVFMDSLAQGDSGFNYLSLENLGGSPLQLALDVVEDTLFAESVSGIRPPLAQRATAWSLLHDSSTVSSLTQSHAEARPALAIDTPFVETLTDPAGDGGVVDVVSLHTYVTFLEVVFELRCSTPIDVTDFGGFISLDTDRNPATGVEPSFGVSGQDIGADFEVLLFSVEDGYITLEDSLFNQIGAYPVVAGSLSVAFSIPTADFNPSGRFVDVTGVVGNADGPTDWIPDVGHGTVTGIRWLTFHPEQAEIAPGDVQVVDISLDTRALVGGSFTRFIRASSNDPAHSIQFYPVTLRVTGVPDIVLDRDSAFFDSGFVGFETVQTVMLSNRGTDSLTVTVASSDPSTFAVTDSTLRLGVGETIPLEVAFRPARTGPFSESLRVRTNDPDQPEFTLPLSGTARWAPEAVIPADPLALSVRQDQTDSVALTMGNLGPGELIWRGTVSGIFPGVEFRPDSGMVPAGDSARPRLVFRGQGLPDGVLNYLVSVFTNDPRMSRVDIPTSLEVVGIRPGDVNADFIINASDIVQLVSFIFKEGPEPAAGTGDPNCDNSVTVLDIMFLVHYVFQSGPASDCS